MYVAPLGNFWKIRSKKVALLNDKEVISFYETIKSQNRKMKKDELALYENPSKQFRNNYDVEEDKFKGTILVSGYMNNNAITELVKKYKSWNVIE